MSMVPVDPVPVVSVPTVAPSIVGWLLQVAHRLACVGLFGLVGTVACLYLDRDARVPVAVAAASGILGLCAALLARSASPRVGLLIVLLSLGVMAFATLVSAALPAAAVGVVLTDVALCAGLLARTAEPDGPARWPEATGVLVFNLVVVAVAFSLLLRDRSDVLREAGRAFFTPPPLSLPR